MSGLRAVLVSVDYWDILAVTLPANARHFSRVVVVTSPGDARTREVVASVPNAACHVTDAFTRSGACFNKGLALEESFDAMGREGWFAVMDADVVLPSRIAWPELRVGTLYSPYRRMLDPLPRPLEVPPESEWHRLPLHPQQREWAGFFQLAHADDLALRARPWYPVDWVHAGGCDSEFQAKWPPSHKVRLPFEVLHLGPAGENWAGRASPYADGSRHPEADARRARVRAFVRGRSQGPGRFAREKLPPAGG